MFFAMADDTRRELFQTLIRNGGTSASELARGLPISRQAVGKHLEVLSEARLVRPRRSGREVRYEPQTQTLKEASQWLNTLARQWDRRLDRLANLAESGLHDNPDEEA
ncbi:metalloregulator ArsR/SmtB family transcription factor [Phytoactinopolyspora sp. XMNu-373]|uniref:Metalloregulator ArsR/SmtB family transcription factor n=1 Tax=Phytoactinopolyspora mesophila TaxID=2650750 RepID=A0A7K3M6E2_9ACTN|nr:metalloregulator ArsR/SmtB family transcription factor [Phytoactinopolyspora mesophila]